jgi:hypothetical protein
MKKLTLSFILLLSINVAKAELLTFTFTTQSTGQSFAPRHVLAVWLEKDDGSFVKTLYLRANARKKYLYTWKNRSNNNSVDALTGSTLNSHGQRTIYWNGRDLTGNVSPSGIYKIKVEFTEKHAQGPLLELAFAKDTAVLNLSPANQSNFTNISLIYDPKAIGMESEGQLENSWSIFPNPASDYLYIRLQIDMLQKGTLIMFSMEGKEVYRTYVESQSSQKTLIIAVTDIPKGIYYIVYRSKEQRVRKKVIIL